MSKVLKSKTYSHRSAGLLLLVGVLAGVTVGGGVGVIAASSTKSVTVCANKKTNVLRYAKNGKCAKTETKVVLNQTGANGISGATGAKGDTGAAGAKGDAGTAGTNGTNGTNATVAITQQSICGAGGTSLCKVGMTGPGGGLIFFVDYNDQYPGFDYLEAAPEECQSSTSRSSDSSEVLAARGWAAQAVGQGQANTTAILAVFGSDTTSDNAAKYADALASGVPGGCVTSKDDWFLGSLGEMMLMYTNLRQAGVGGFYSGYYWSSSEVDGSAAWLQNFEYGGQSSNSTRTDLNPVRPVRAF
jgi:hypothetical protein